MGLTKKRFLPFELGNFDNCDIEALVKENTASFKEGDTIKGKIVDKNKDFVIVDVGLKNEGLIPIAEFKSNHSLEEPQLGEFVDVSLERIEGKGGRVMLSREKALKDQVWSVLEKYYESGEFVEGQIFERVKGGFAVNISEVVCFLPGSQLDIRPIRDVAHLMGVVEKFQILKMDKKLGNVVVSRRAVIESSRHEARDEMLATISEGLILDGVVKNITDYGVFVDLGSIDGLLHITDISWKRINHPSEVLKLGDVVKVKVVKFDKKNKRVSLGMKQIDSNPWGKITSSYEIGKVYSGNITSIADYGVFVELVDGIEGLVHLSEIEWGKAYPQANNILSVGQAVDFQVIEIDSVKNRVSLSIKRCKTNPWQEFASKHQVGDIIKGPINHVADFGLFVDLSSNISGLIHANDLEWSAHGAHLLRNYNKGDEIECKILSIDIEKEKIGLGIKQLSEDPFANMFSSYKVGQEVTAKVFDISSSGITVDLEGLKCFISKAEISADRYDQNPKKYRVDDKVDALIVSLDEHERSMVLSIKALEKQQRARVIKEYGSVDSGATLGKILGQALPENNNNDK